MRSLALLAVVGCAHTPYVALRPDPAPPAGSTTEVFVARDGTQLLARHWAAAGEPRGVLVIMHGLKDHSARYATFAAHRAAGGYSVYAFDLRGHGRSEGKRVAPDDWFDYVDDLDRFVTLVESREPGKPVFVFGHSMGGAIATLVAERHRPVIAGLVLSAPALAIDAAPLLIAATRFAGALMPGAPALDLDNADFSSDPAAEAAMDRDELISQPKAPARTAAGLVAGMHAVWANVEQLTMPVLAVHGTADRLTAPSGSRALIRSAAATDKTLRIYPGLFHDLLHEPAGAQVEQDIAAWLDAHTGGAAVAAPPITTEHLTGDPRGWTQAIELATGIARGKDSRFAPSTTFAFAAAIDLARPEPIGWHGSFAARRVSSHYAIALRPLGLGIRAGDTELGASIGGGVLFGKGGPFITRIHATLAAGLWLEQPLGPLHLGLRAEGERPFTDVPVLTTWLAATLRAGGDRRYWPHARAGVGPSITAGYDCVIPDDAAIQSARGTVCGWAALVGLELFGAD